MATIFDAIRKIVAIAGRIDEITEYINNDSINKETQQSILETKIGLIESKVDNLVSKCKYLESTLGEQNAQFTRKIEEIKTDLSSMRRHITKES